MMRAHKLSLFAVGLLAIVLLGSGAACLIPVSASARESCIDCHTNPDRLIPLIPERQEQAGESGES